METSTERKSRRPSKPLTREMVEAYQPEPKVYEVPDPGCHGLYLRVMPTGKRSWAFRYSVGGRTARVSMGMYPEVTIQQARAKAARFHGDVRNLEDPAAKVKAEKSAWVTVSDLWKDFDEDHIKEKRPSTQKGYRHYGTTYILPYIGRMRVQDIDPAVVAEVQKRAAKLSNRAANYTIAVLSKLLSFARQRGVSFKDGNPCEAVPRKPTSQRHRYLRSDEIDRVWRALEILEDAGAEVVLAESRGKVFVKLPLPVATALRVLILTGCRRSEVCRLKWSEIEVRGEMEGVATLLEHKTMSRGPKRVMLTEEVMQAIKRMPVHTDSEFVFAGEGKDGTIAGSLYQGWRAVRYLAKVQDVTLHDLRHTYASMAITAGLTLEQTGQLLGHSTSTTTKRYAHLVDEAGLENAARAAAKITRLGRKRA